MSQLNMPNMPGDCVEGKTFIDMSEHNYKLAISIRPRYWDAAINLASLLSAQTRFEEAMTVYENIEAIMVCSH
jgi:hypothetical protein